MRRLFLLKTWQFLCHATIVLLKNGAFIHYHIFTLASAAAKHLLDNLAE